MQLSARYSRCALAVFSAALFATVASAAGNADSGARLRELFDIPTHVALTCRDADDRALALDLCEDRIRRGADHGLSITQAGKLAVIRVNDPPAPSGLVVGRVLPAPDRADLAGSQVTAARLRGRVFLVSFFFADCRPCIDEVPILNEFAQRNSRIGVIAITFDPADTARAFAKKFGFTWPVVAEAQTYIERLGVVGYPTLALLDTDGRIAAVRTGLRDASGTRMTAPQLEHWVESQIASRRAAPSTRQDAWNARRIPSSQKCYLCLWPPVSG